LSERAGDEAQAVARLTEGIELPAARAVLARCLSGELASSAAIAQLLYLTGSAAAVHKMVDTVTRNALFESRSGDRLIQDRVDDLTQIVVDPELGVDRLERLQRKDAT
jgi:predicted transcriptional regulator